MRILIALLLIFLFMPISVHDAGEYVYAHEVEEEAVPIEYEKRLAYMVSRGTIRATEMEITAYTDADCDKSPSHPLYGVTASGEYTREGIVAAGEGFPFGTKLYISGYGEVEVKDRGGAISHRHLDIWMENRGEAIKFGRQYRTVYILEWGKG